MMKDWKLDRDIFLKTIYTPHTKLQEHIDINVLLNFIYDPSWSGYKEVLLAYQNNYDHNTGCVNVRVALPKHKWGRIVPFKQLSLSVFHRPIRHTLAQNNYVDVDMVNAQPSILLEVCRANNIELPSLTFYCKNRDSAVLEIMNHHKVNRDSAKKLVIRLIMGGSYDAWAQENNTTPSPVPWVKQLEQEVCLITEMIYQRNTHIEKDVLKCYPNKWHTLHDKKKGVVALWCQTIERLLQETVLSFLVEEKQIPLDEIVPCQDGFMVPQIMFYQNLPQDCHTVLLQKFNIHVEFKVKPFDQAVTNLIQYIPKMTFLEAEDSLSHKKLADKFMEHFHTFVALEQGNLYVFWKGKWYLEDKNKLKLNQMVSESLHDVVKEEIKSVDSFTFEEKSKLLKLLRRNLSLQSNIKSIEKHVIAKIAPSFNKFDTNAFLLGFENGVYDLQLDIFRDYSYEDYVTLTTGYDYAPATDPEKKLELSSIIESIHPNPDVRKLYLQILASGLDGVPYQKVFLFTGSGGNGKGWTAALMNKVLGKNYYLQPNNGIIRESEKSNTPSPDIFDLKDKRYLNFKEVSCQIKSAFLKNISGGATMVGRKLHHDNQSFLLSSTIVMEFNQPPEWDQAPSEAERRRLVYIHFPINFTDDPNKIDKTIGDITFRKANTLYETQEWLESMKLYFLDLLLEVYRNSKDGVKGIKFDIPQEVREKTESFVDKQNIFHRIFYDLWMDDPSCTEPVKLQKVWSSVQLHPEYKELSFKDKKQYSRSEFHKWIKLEKGTVIKDNQMCVSGIKFVYEEDDVIC
jgi:hypothetical protein